MKHMAMRALLGFALFSCSAWAVNSKVCGECHQAIFQRYSATPMARTSAIADSGNTPLPAGDIHDDANAATFQLTRNSDGTLLRISQSDTAAERMLSYAIGAGVTGRSYAYMKDGFLFQAPVSYYSATGTSELSPGFEASSRLNLTRPVEPACLHCHASGLRTLANTVNGYSAPAFDEGGVSCERCHGAGETHVIRMKAANMRLGAAIVNPAKLAPAERDSVCAQCHLVGVIRIAKHVATGRYEPGKRLFDSTSAFIWSTGRGESSANSHFEQLVSSACWRGSGGRLWCGTCHSVHAASKTSSNFRERCLACHTVNAKPCTAAALKRSAVKDDCILCHMPARALQTVQHAAQVDHTISRVPSEPAEHPVPADASLIPFPGSSGEPRELGLAYAGEALPRNNQLWGMQALALLKQAEFNDPKDAPVLLQLGQLYDRMRQEDRACELYSRAVTNGATGTAALVNLGTCQAKRGELEAAMLSWKQALDRNPAMEAARLNLAIAQFQTGRVDLARKDLELGLIFDPFSPAIKKAIDEMQGK